MLTTTLSDPKRGRTAYPFLEGCKEFGLSKSRAYVLVKEGVLKVRHDGRKSYLCGESLMAWWNSLPTTQPEKHVPPLAKTGAVRPMRRRRATSGAARSAKRSRSPKAMRRH